MCWFVDVVVAGLRRGDEMWGVFALRRDTPRADRHSVSASSLRETALTPLTALLSRNEMVSLKLPPLCCGQTGEPKGLSFRPALLDERLGLEKSQS